MLPPPQPAGQQEHPPPQCRRLSVCALATGREDTTHARSLVSSICTATAVLNLHVATAALNLHVATAVLNLHVILNLYLQVIVVKFSTAVLVQL